MFSSSEVYKHKAKINPSHNLDENKKIIQFSDDITCDICLKQYSTDQNDSKSPRILKCGHTFCLECLSKEFEKQNKTNVFKCRYDLEDTSLSELRVNVMLIDTIISYDHYKLKMINQYQNAIKELQEDITKDILENTEQTEEISTKLIKHLINLLKVKKRVGEFIKGLRNIKNQDTQLLFNLDEYKKLENYLNELKIDGEFYKKQFDAIKIRLAKLSMIENENHQNEQNLTNNDIKKLVDYHIYILHLKKYVKEISDEDIVKKKPEGLSKFYDIEEKIINRLEEIEQKFNVEQLLHYIKNISDKAYRIGILGSMNSDNKSFINRLRGKNDTDLENDAAPVKINDCNEYKWKENYKLVFCDYPGYSSSDNIENYFEQFLSKKKLCDIYIILYNRLEEDDIKIAKYIFNTLGVEFLMCKTHSDNHIIESLDVFIENSLSDLDREKYDKYFDEKFTRKLCKDRTFITSCDTNYAELLRSIKNKIEENLKVYIIGILGLVSMNVGKSSFINRIRGKNDTDWVNDAAPVKINDCTGDINEYKWKEKNKLYVFCDHPGYSSSYKNIEHYFEQFLSKKKLCDIYIILYDRLEENDVKIAKYIFNTLDVEFLMCRTHSDNHIDQIILDREEKGKKINDEEAFNLYKETSLSELDTEKYSKYFDESFTRELCKKRTHFISCDRRHYKKYEWKILNEKILELANSDLAKNFSPYISGKKLIRKKREALEKNILGLSIASAATDIIPVAGAFADLGIIYYEAKKYRKKFGLTQENFDKMADLFGVTLNDRKSISRIIGLDSIYVNIKNLVVLLLGSIPSGVQAISFFVSLSTVASISFPLFAPVAVIMALASAPVSYCMAKDVLTKILCQMEFDSFRMIDFLEKKIKIGESDFSYVISEREAGPEEPDSFVCQHEICQKSQIPSKKNCGKCQKAFCSDHCKKIMTIPLKQLPKMHKVCDKCYVDANSAERIEEDANINKLVFKRDSEKCSVVGCKKRLYYSIMEKTKKHHCEKCGSCICYDHSKNELKFSIIVLEPEDVCDQCYENEVNN